MRLINPRSTVCICKTARAFKGQISETETTGGGPRRMAGSAAVRHLAVSSVAGEGSERQQKPGPYLVNQSPEVVLDAV